jgi:hypothetical protein
MNKQQQEEAANTEAYRVYNLAESYQRPFTLGELWGDLHRSVHYGRLAAMLMRWWREGIIEKQDGDGRWHQGYFFSKPPLPKRHYATYRFKGHADA